MSSKAYVIGGGPLGLGVANELMKNDYSVVIIEASSTLLGLASTFSYKGLDIEKYYHFFYKNDHYNSVKWLREYSETEPLIEWKDISTDSVVSGKRYDFDSIIEICKLCGFKFPKVIYSLLKLMLFKPSEKLDTVSAEEWATDAFGYNFASSVWIPLLNQKFGSRSKDVSAFWLATRIKRHLSTRGSGSGKSKFGYLVDTYTPYVDNFQNKIIKNGGEVLFNQPVIELIENQGRITKIKTSNQVIDVKSSPVFSTISYAILNQLVKKNSFIKGLDSFVNMGVVVCILFIKKQLSNHYWTTVSDNKHPFAAILQQNRLFEKSDFEIVYLSRYCEVQDELFTDTDVNIQKNWTKSLLEIYPHINNSDILDFKVYRNKNAAPLPFIGSNKYLNNISCNATNFYFEGYENIYPEDRGVGNSIKIGKDLVFEFLKK